MIRRTISGAAQLGLTGSPRQARPIDAAVNNMSHATMRDPLRSAGLSGN